MRQLQASLMLPLPNPPPPTLPLKLVQLTSMNPLFVLTNQAPHFAITKYREDCLSLHQREGKKTPTASPGMSSNIAITITMLETAAKASQLTAEGTGLGGSDSLRRYQAEFIASYQRWGFEEVISTGCLKKETPGLPVMPNQWGVGESEAST